MRYVNGLLGVFCLAMHGLFAQTQDLFQNPHKSSSDLTQGAVTFEHTAGRFGDCLLHYLRAKWFSYHYQLPLLYQDTENFPYFRELVLYDEEVHLGPIPLNATIVDIHYKCPEPKERFMYLYRIPYFPEIHWDLEVQGRDWFSFKVDWKDSEFRKIARKMIAPNHKLQLIVPNESTVNIAIHVREGGGVDPSWVSLFNPIKIPPLSYYHEALSKVLEFFKGQKICCYLFTDALEPEKIVGKIQEWLDPDEQIDFQYRKEGNRPDANVLEDFFSLFNFDVLIRSGSNFSHVPQLIHSYAVVCSPENCTILDQPLGKVITIDQIDFVVNEDVLDKLIKRVSNPP